MRRVRSQRWRSVPPRALREFSRGVDPKQGGRIEHPDAPDCQEQQDGEGNGDRGLAAVRFQEAADSCKGLRHRGGFRETGKWPFAERIATFVKLLSTPTDNTIVYQRGLCAPKRPASLHFALEFHCVPSFLRFEFPLAGGDSCHKRTHDEGDQFEIRLS